MRKTITAIAAAAAALSLGAAVATASSSVPWWHHTLANGHVVCNHDDTSKPSPVDGGPFADKETCEAFTPAAAGTATPPLVSNMFLCYSKFEQDGGQVFTNTEALAILADPSIAGWTQAWAPFAVAGTDTTGAFPNISGDHLVCNPAATLKPTGEWLYADNNGDAETAPFGPSVSGDAGYELVK